MAKDKDTGYSKKQIEMWDPRKLLVVGVDTKDGPEHPLYDDRIKLPIEENLVKSIKARGIIQTVLAEKGPNDERYVVDGRRRVLHARIACEQLEAEGQAPVLVPVMLRGFEDDVSRFGTGRAANEFRKDDTPMQRAKNAQWMLDRGATPEQVAADFNVSPEAIRQWTALLKLTPDAVAALNTGAITQTAASQIASLPAAQQAEVLADVKAAQTNGNKVTAADVSKKVADKKGKKGPETPKDRVLKATEILEEYVTEGKTTIAEKDVYIGKLCKAITGMGVEKFTLSILAAKKEDE